MSVQLLVSLYSYFTAMHCYPQYHMTVSVIIYIDLPIVLFIMLSYWTIRAFSENRLGYG